jgi:hypothetical protein
MRRTAWLFGLASIAIVSSACTAHALGPVDVEVAARAGLAAPNNGGQNPLGFGLGGRAGVVLFDHLYGGLNLMYSFGSSQAYFFNGPITTESVHTLMYGVEAGWGFKLDNVIIRPQVGLGNANFGYTFTCTGTSGPLGCAGADVPNNNVYVEPGLTLLVVPVRAVFVGGDASVLVFPGINESLFIALHGQVGVTF